MSQRPNDEPLQTTKNTIDNYSIQTVFIIHKKKCFNRNNSNKTHKNSKKEKEKKEREKQPSIASPHFLNSLLSIKIAK